MLNRVKVIGSYILTAIITLFFVALIMVTCDSMITDVQEEFAPECVCECDGEEDGAVPR